MTLSDDEERILSEMEAQLAASDPRLVDDVTSTTVYTASLRNVKWAILLFIVGVVFLIFTITTFSPWLPAVGYLIMLGAILFLQSNLTKLGKAGISQVMQSSKSKGSMGGYVNSMRANMRKRFRKENNN